MMKHKKFVSRIGFTLIEVSLFLAITGVLFIGILIGTQNALRDQRFYDATNNFYEFLQSVYSQVSNPQSVGRGDSEKYAIYGKLIVFGESTGLDGNTINNDGIQRIYVYDVVGRPEGVLGTGDVRKALSDLGANVLVKNDNTGKLDYAGLVEDYMPRWDSEIEVVNSSNPFKGSILIVRHPNSGTINTLVSSSVVQANKALIDGNAALGANPNYGGYTTLLKSLLDDASSFKVEDINFCINPEGSTVTSELRRNVRIVKNARNSSGVELIDLDGDDNLCRHH